MKTVEIFDEENSIIIDDKYDTTDFKFFPEDKKFTISSSKKDDCFFNYLTYEYRISANPVEMQFRLLEKSYEPPKEHSVKDGVVLELELKKQDLLFPDEIENLKKEVEWSKAPLFNNYEVNLYILSKHPEIISKENYRKFLRQSTERIKMGVFKTEQEVKKDSNGLQILTSGYGKNVWYPNSKSEEREMNEYFDLSEEKRKKSPYGKKMEYIEKFNDSLFKENSQKYVGISDYEFKTSSELLDYIDKLLDKKDTTIKEKLQSPEQVNFTNKHMNIFIYLLTAFFIILKLTDSVYWSWLAVLSPVLLWEAYGFLSGFFTRFSYSILKKNE